LSSVATNSQAATNLGAGPGQYDTFLFLVEGDFDPGDPSANVVGCNDNKGAGCGSGTAADCLSSISADLTLDEAYTLVVTSFATGAEGPVALEIDGGSASMTISAGNNQSTL